MILLIDMGKGGDDGIAVLDVTVVQAGKITGRPRHVKAALYWQRQHVKNRIPLPAGCDLEITQHGGSNKATLISTKSLLAMRELWNKGTVPPPMPGEKRC